LIESVDRCEVEDNAFCEPMRDNGIRTASSIINVP
jgi:hypothetical protein